MAARAARAKLRLPTNLVVTTMISPAHVPIGVSQKIGERMALRGRPGLAAIAHRGRNGACRFQPCTNLGQLTLAETSPLLSVIVRTVSTLLRRPVCHKG
jgi:hypothetical protein